MYGDEIGFIERKLSGGKKVQWKPVAALEQVASVGLSKFDALDVVSRLQSQLDDKCKKQQKLFSNMVSIIKDSIVVIKIPFLREVFGEEIDGFSGGGGRKFRNRSVETTMRRR